MRNRQTQKALAAMGEFTRWMDLFESIAQHVATQHDQPHVAEREALPCSLGVALALQQARTEWLKVMDACSYALTD